MNTVSTDQEIELKMQAAGVGGPTLRAFLRGLHKVRSGDRGMLPESAIEALGELPRSDTLPPPPAAEAASLLRHLAVIKLNGGLGTSMGLEKAKSLVPVRPGEAFLDFIARQVLHLRRGGTEPAFYLMHSFSTQADSLQHLKRHPALAGSESLDFLQNKVPKIDAATHRPVAWPRQPELEWCPPGHGDIYPSLVGAGLLDRLLRRGIRFAFVSNADNLGATVDLALLHYFADSGLSFLMEAAERTSADRKGGHLARRRDNRRLVLRESAQTPAEDEAAFQAVDRHRYFNTNNLWLRLDHLDDALARHGGVLPLPLITNLKTVDPRDPSSTPIIQIESAMGAAIECFERSGAIVVPRTRFAPVKSTADLLVLRSDAYRVTADHRLVLDESRHGHPPDADLDPRHHRTLDAFEHAFRHGPPSLLHCRSLRVRGPVEFEAGVVCRGRVEFENPSSQPRTVPAGVYEDRKVQLD